MEYHKINSIFKRDKKTNQFIMGAYSNPELEYLSQDLWNWDEKIDGTNIRIIYDTAGRRFGGRTDRASIPAQLFQRLEEFFPIEKLAAVFGDPKEDCPIILYGEGYGKGIQNGGLYLDRQDFILFDIKIGRWWLKKSDISALAEQLGIQCTPSIGSGTLAEAMTLVQKGFMSAIGQAPAEGLICRPRVDLLDRSGKRIITKIKTKDFK